MSIYPKNGLITIKGSKPGPTVSILVGIHGDEICGPKALQKLLPKLKIKTGKVFFVYGNLLAIKKGVRQINLNLNRCFKPISEFTKQEKKSYEFKRAQIIKKYLDQSSTFLDIHSSSSKESIPFIICEKHSFDWAKKLPFSLRSSGWDKLEPGGTDYYGNKQKKIAICVECGYHNNPKAVNKAIESIKTFLQLTGNLSKPKKSWPKTNQKYIKVYKIYHTKTDHFALIKKFADFQWLPKNTTIGFDGNQPIKNSQAGYIIFARSQQKKQAEAFLLGK